MRFYYHYLYELATEYPLRAAAGSITHDRDLGRALGL